MTITIRTIALSAAALAALAAYSVRAQDTHKDHGAPATAQAQGAQGSMHQQMQEKMQQKMQNMDHSKMGKGKMGQGAADDDSASTKAYRAANARMHTGMNIKFTGDADVDFVKGMIPHHQGAVEMAKILIEHGKDPELKKLGTEIVAAQEKEIAFMKEWLAKKGK